MHSSTARYDNTDRSSVAKGFSDLGYNVLNINRPGYAGSPIPSTATPLADSLPALIDLIDLVYREKTGAQQGIVLIGHSLGGALALVIAAKAGTRLPVLGVSALGTLPSTDRLNLIPEPDPDPASPRFVAPRSAENLTRFLGSLESVNVDALSSELAAAVFEPSKSESFM